MAWWSLRAREEHVHEKIAIALQKQNNASECAGQRVRAQHAPWVVLGVWLLIAFVYAAYYRFHDWGPGGGTPQFVTFAAGAIALGGWLTVWLLLWSQPLYVRLAYFVIGFIGIFAVSLFGDAREIEFFWEFPKLVVGTGAVTLMMRRSGCQIVKTCGATAVADTTHRRRFQYSLLDLLVLTAGTASFLSTLLANGTSEFAVDLVHTSMFVFTVAFVTVVVLASPRHWISILAMVIWASLVLAANWLLDSHGQLGADLSFGAGACLLIAASVVRSRGYRFTDV